MSVIRVQLKCNRMSRFKNCTAFGGGGVTMSPAFPLAGVLFREGGNEVGTIQMKRGSHYVEKKYNQWSNFSKIVPNGRLARWTSMELATYCHQAYYKYSRLITGSSFGKSYYSIAFVSRVIFCQHTIAGDNARNHLMNTVYVPYPVNLQNAM
jgi:hypothetical protein